MKQALPKYLLSFLWMFLLLISSDSIRRNVQASEILTLANFENGIHPIEIHDAPPPLITRNHATEGSFALSWTNGYIGWRNFATWSGYDSLRIDFYNNSSRPVQILLEIKDNNSTNYWSRVNYPITLVPGASTTRISTQLSVGELSRPGRPLDLSSVRTVILSRQDHSIEGVEIILDRVQLEKEDKPDMTGIWAFDFGREESPLFPGMNKFTKNTRYTPERGYGLHSDTFIWDPYPQASNLLRPDSLYQDSIFISKGTIQIDLPNGKYRAFMNIDYAGGFWGENAYFRERKVFAQGQPVVDETQNAFTSLEKYFQFENTEDRFDQDSYEKYYSKIFHEKTFDFEVKDGKLLLTFQGEDCYQTPCWSIALSALVLYPLDQKAKGETYLEYIQKRRKQEFDAQYSILRYQNKNTLTELPATDRVWTYFPAFSREIPQNYIPSAVEVQADRLVHFGTVGEKEILNFVLLPTQNQKDVVVSVSNLTATRSQSDGLPATIPAAAITLHRVSHRLSRITPDGSLTSVLERYLIPAHAVDLEAGINTRIWAQVQVPAQAVPGIYTGNFKLEFLDGKTRLIPLEFRVYGAKLVASDIPTGPFQETIQENYWYPYETGARRGHLNELSLQKMRSLGLDMVSFESAIEIHGDANSISLNTDRINQKMKRARELGFKRLVAYSMVFDGFDLCNAFPQDYFKTGEQRMDEIGFYSRVAFQLNEESEKNHWLPLDVIICDESLADRYAHVQTRAQLLNQKSSANIRYTATLSLGKNAGADQLDYARSFPMPFINEFTIENLKKTVGDKPWVFYNQTSRSTFGFYLYALGLQGIKPSGRIAWVWNQNSGNPYFALDSREDDYGWCNSTRLGNLICTIHLDRQIREGIKDYRYALTLEKELEKLDPIQNQTWIQKGRTLLQKTVQVSGPGETAPGQSSEYYQESDQLRQELAELIETIQLSHR